MIKTKKLKTGIKIVFLLILAAVVISNLSYYLVTKRAEHAIDSLNIPESATVFLETKSEVSDIYYVHVRAEKIIRCEEGSEYFIQYVKDNNSSLALLLIDVYDMGGMSDMTIYEYGYLGNGLDESIAEDGIDKYRHVNYERPLLWAPLSWVMR